MLQNLGRARKSGHSMGGIANGDMTRDGTCTTTRVIARFLINRQNCVSSAHEAEGVEGVPKYTRHSYLMIELSALS